MVADAEGQDALVDVEAWRVELEVLGGERRAGMRRTVADAVILMQNFLSLKEMLRISLQGNPICGVTLRVSERNMRLCLLPGKSLRSIIGVIVMAKAI